MKRLTLLIIFCGLTLFLVAQNSIEFLGMPIRNNTKTAFAETLKEKGYKYDWEKKGYVWYKGKFAGYNADVILVPMGDNDDIRGVQVSLKNMDPYKFGQLFAELIKKYMAKYPDFKYKNEISTEGTSVIFSKIMEDGLMDCISLDSNVKGTNIELRISYFVALEDEEDNNGSNNSEGLDLDDL